MLNFSIVIPVFENEKFLNELYLRISSSMKTMSNNNYELIFIDDGSTDNSWIEISRICDVDQKVKGLKLSRNFGQHHAILAGLEKSIGQWVVVMDADLQHSPEDIDKLFAQTKLGYDQVVGIRVNRKDNFIKKSLSTFFYFIFNFLSGAKLNSGISNYGIYSRKVINAIILSSKAGDSFGLSANWVGFKRSEIEISHNPRKYGKSTYTLTKRLRLALGSITNYSTRLLHFIIMLGLTISFISFLFTFTIVLRYFLDKTVTSGWTSLIAAIALSTGIITSCLGIIGMYLARFFEYTKNRPVYIIKNEKNFI